MRVVMKRTVILPRKGGGTETYAVGGHYEVTEEVAELLADAIAEPEEEPDEQEAEAPEPNPPPPVLDIVGDYEE